MDKAKRKIGKWKLLLLVAMIALFGRIIYVNICYPKTSIQYHKLGEVVNYNGLQIVCNGVAVYPTIEDVEKLMEQNEDFKTEQYKEFMKNQQAYIYVVDLNVTNTSEEINEFVYWDASLCIGNSLNGTYNMYISGLLNEGKTRDEFAAGQSRNVKIAYQILNNGLISEKRFAGLTDEKCCVQFLTFYKADEIKAGVPERRE